MVQIPAFFAENAGIFGRYLLFPLWVAIVAYIATELVSRRRGITLGEEFHTKSFIISASVVLGWMVFLLIPSEIYLPLEQIGVRFVYGVFMLVLTYQYFVFIFTSLVSRAKTALGMGAGAGLLRSTLAVSVWGSICAEDPNLSHEGAASIMMANTVMVLRNFVIVWVIGAFLGLFVFPPTLFVAPMAVLFLFCAGVTLANIKLGAEFTQEEEIETFSLRAIAIFMTVFIVMYYLAVALIERFQFAGIYVLSGVAAFLYGSAHLFIIASLLFTNIITIDVAFIAAVIVTAGSILSDLPYSIYAGADELTKLLLVSEAIPFAAGIAVLIYLI
jgi:uncharacterized membrane protein (DUF4010 family)